jgi:hypothetical protein
MTGNASFESSRRLVFWFVLSYEGVPEERCPSSCEIILGSFAVQNTKLLKKVKILTLIASVLSSRLA